VADTPDLAPILKPLFGVFALVGWVILIGLHLVWRATFGWLFTTLADFLDVGIPIPHFGDLHPFGSVADWLRSLDRNVDGALVGAANRLEHAAVWLLSRVGYFFGWIAREIEGLALDVEHALLRLVRVTIPRLIRAALRRVWRELRALARYARKMIPRLARQLFRFTKWATHQIAAGARHLAVVFKWIKAVVRLHWRVISALLKRALRLERALMPRGFRRLFVAALGPLGLAWLLTDNLLRLGKWLARLDYGAVYEFTKDALAIASETDLCKLMAYQYDVAVLVFEPVMQALVGLEDWFCRHAGESMPSAIELRPGYGGGWTPSATPPLRRHERLAPGVPLPHGVIQA
jgi:hypothetical protein